MPITPFPTPTPGAIPSQQHLAAPTVSQAHPSTNAAPARPGQGTITTRFQPGLPARDLIELQTGCHCNSNSCCFRGHRCDGTIGHECTTTSSANKTVTDRACAALRQRFLTKNPCNAPQCAPY
ncbi:MAG: hypothetical protein WBP64_18590 [Nitrososphaeraceae archaeon]